MIAVYIMIGVAVYWLLTLLFPSEPPTHDPGEPPPS